MKEKSIKNLIRLVEESDIDVLEVSRWGTKVRITRRLDGPSSGNGSSPVAQYPAAPREMPVPVSLQEEPAGEHKTDEDKYVPVKSPMVGTFYVAPAPDAEPYTDVGRHVDKGQVVCIVEAMKLMNEIESEVAGRVVRLCIENAQPVEFGQALFLIDPSG
jgi:acetyl-CoA carboxylase biotin carboxyl carrier protein